MSPYLAHITLTTGHLRRSYREEVGDETLALLAPWLAKAISTGAPEPLPVASHKEQHGIEKNFGFLKDDQIVNALFLKRPERIEALGLILLISLLIWRLMERVMRAELDAHKTTLPGWDNKRTARPTAYMMTWKFKGVLLLCIGGQRQLAKPLTETQIAFLNALQVPASCFTHYPKDG